jgi:hypothetical protein
MSYKVQQRSSDVRFQGMRAGREVLCFLRSPSKRLGLPLFTINYFKIIYVQTPPGGHSPAVAIGPC